MANASSTRYTLRNGALQVVETADGNGANTDCRRAVSTVVPVIEIGLVYTALPAAAPPPAARGSPPSVRKRMEPLPLNVSVVPAATTPLGTSEDGAAGICESIHG